MFQIADEVILDLQIAQIHRRHPRQRVHILDHGPRRIVLQTPVRAPEAQACDAVEGKAVGHVLAGVVEFLARDEVDGFRGGERARRIDRHLGPHHADLEEPGIGLLEQFRDAPVFDE